MLKSDLVNLLISQRGLTPRQAEDTVDHIFDTMAAALTRGEHIEIRGFGTLNVRQYKGYEGRNPKTSKTIEVRPKRGILFRMGKEIRDRVNAMAEPAPEDEAAQKQPAEAAAVVPDPTETAA